MIYLDYIENQAGFQAGTFSTKYKYQLLEAGKLKRERNT